MHLPIHLAPVTWLRRRARGFATQPPVPEEVVFLRTMFDEAPAGIAQVSPDGRFLRVNRKYCDIVGHSEEELRKRRFLDITHEDDVAIGVRERARLATREIEGYVIEKRYVRADGSTAWAEVAVSAVRRPTGEIEHLLAVLQDIGERRENQAALRKSEQLHRAILDAALDAIITIDRGGKILEWNPAAEQMFGYTKADAVGREMATLVVPPRLRAQHRSGLARHLATGEDRIVGRRIHLPAQRADGTEFPAEVSITRVATLEPPVFTGHVRDLTEQERTLRALRESEEQRVRMLEEAIATRDEFLSIASHELRTPATSLSLAVEALARLADRGALEQSPRTLRFLHTCERQSKQLRRLVDRLLDVGRVRTGGLHLDLEVFDLGALVREVVSSMEEQLTLAGCVAMVRVDAVATGLWDHSRLEEVFGNLLSNASKYGAGKPIDVTVGESDGLARVAVRDRGIGIPKEQQRTIFEKFDRAATVGSYGGLGLGLYIAREIVQAHSGTIHVESESGVGSTFTVALPTHLGSELESESTAEERRKETKP